MFVCCEAFKVPAHERLMGWEPWVKSANEDFDAVDRMNTSAPRSVLALYVKQSALF
jgi:hypothetical protein